MPTPRTPRAAEKTAPETAEATARMTDVEPDAPADPADLIEKVLDNVALHAEDIRQYIDVRSEELRAPRLGGNPGGSAMIEAAAEAQFLRSLSRFLDWLSAGKPGPKRTLTEDQKSAYRAAKLAGATFPPEIERAL